MLAMRGISKRFGATHALDGVSLDLRAGEVHALVGENGAGKSTLIKIMTGVYPPDDGEVLRRRRARVAAERRRRPAARGRRHLPGAADLPRPQRGREHLHRPPRPGRVVRWRKMCADAAAILDRLDVRLDPRMPAAGLPVAAQQAVEIAKAISLDVRVLIMDEPTAALSAHEVARLFRQVRQLRAEGVAVLFISHRLDEVFEIADRISVFRDGRHISTAARADVTTRRADRAPWSGGRSPTSTPAASTAAASWSCGSADLGRTGEFSGVGFDLHRGEVLGLRRPRRRRAHRRRARAVRHRPGRGRDDRAATAGRSTIRTPRQAHGPGHRLRVRGPPPASACRCPSRSPPTSRCPTLRRYVSRLGLVDRRAERGHGRARSASQLGIRTPSSLNQPVGLLSGGNQQKTMLAKWLNTEPTVLILDEPTRGIDVGAKAEVHHIVDELAAPGRGHHPHLVGPARGAGDERPGAGHARGRARWACSIARKRPRSGS